MNAETVDGGAEAGQPVQSLLRCTPVETIGPVGDEVTQLRNVDARRPPKTRRSIRPLRRAKPPTKLIKNILLSARRERDNSLWIGHPHTLRPGTYLPQRGPPPPTRP